LVDLHACDLQLVEKTTEELEAVLIVRKTFGCAVSADGWEDKKGNPLFNANVWTVDGTVFMGADNYQGVTKDAEAVFGFLDKYVKKLGPKYVTAIITDSASVNEAAVRLLQQKYPHIM
jgi:hypothetical protein